MKIHAIQTGTVAITTKWREGAGHGRLRLVNTLLDREWTEPLPIYAFAIEHPEGVIVVDTGETARVSEPGYFPRWQPFFRFAVREHVRPEQEIGPQLKQLGILPSDVRRVVMTHLHTDHAGGLHHFPDNEILVSRAELDYAAGLRGRVRGYPNKRWPAWFRPDPGRPAGRSVRPVPGEHAAHAGRRRDPRGGPGTHPRPTCRCRARRRPHGLSRRRQLLHPGRFAARGRRMASAPTRPPSGSRTSASSPTQPRRPPSTCRRMTPRPQPGWQHASRSEPRGRR